MKCYRKRLFLSVLKYLKIVRTYNVLSLAIKKNRTYKQFSVTDMLVENLRASRML